MNSLRQCQDKQQWDDYVLDNGGHPLQLWGWGDLKSAHNWKADRIFMADEEGEIIGAAQLLIKKLPIPFKSLAYLPRGPIVSEDNRGELLELLSAYVKRVYRSVVLSVEPDSLMFDTPSGWVKSKNYILPSRTIVLDLGKTESELLSDMTKKTRQYIRKSSAEKIEIKMVHSRSDLDKCLEIYHETAKRAGFRLHDDQYYYDAFYKMGDNSPIFAVYSDNQPIAFLWLAISTDVVYELYGGVNDLGQQLRANYALKWYVIKKCKEWGMNRYDFGGLIDGGVTTFKMGWASSETDMAGTYDKPLSAAYQMWSKTLPFGKKITRQIKGIFKR